MRLFWAATCVILVCSVAQAEKAVLTPEKKKEAMEHLDNGRKKFNVAKFEEAANEFVAAYEIAGDPTILYNAAQSYRFAEKHDKALFFYKSFYRQLDAKNPLRAEIEKRIAELTAVIEQAKHATTAPPTGTIPTDQEPRPTDPKNKPAEVARPPEPKPRPEARPETPQPKPKPPVVVAKPKPPAEPSPPIAATPALRYAGYGLAGLAVAGLVIGAGMSGGAAHSASTMEQASKAGNAFGPKLQTVEKNGQLYDTLSYVFYGIGGAAAVAAAVTLYFGLRKPPATTHARITPVFGPNSAGLVLEGSF